MAAIADISWENPRKNPIGKDFFRRVEESYNRIYRDRILKERLDGTRVLEAIEKLFARFKAQSDERIAVDPGLREVVKASVTKILPVPHIERNLNQIFYAGEPLNHARDIFETFKSIMGLEEAPPDEIITQFNHRAAEQAVLVYNGIISALV